MSARAPHRYRLGLLAGDGIGPEITSAAASITSAAVELVPGHSVDWVPLPAGWVSIEADGTALPEETVRVLAECDGWMMGPVDFVKYPAETGAWLNPSRELRHRFDLYANIRPAKNMLGVSRNATRLDLVVVRENLEGFYADRNMFTGHGDILVTPDVGLAIGVFTRKAADRIAQVACRLAMSRARHVKIVHKANVLPNSMGLFLTVCQSVASGYDVKCDNYHADAMASHLIRRPEAFDVLVMENLLGDVFSQLVGELAGSIGLSPSLNAGDDFAMAQAAHGSAPDIAGTDKANPVGEILSCALLLRWLAGRHDDDGLNVAADHVEGAVTGVLARGLGTSDVGGNASTTGFAQAVIDDLRAAV